MPESLNNFFKVFDNIVTTIPSVVGEKIISLNFYNPKVEDLPPIKYHRDEERFKQKYSDKLDRFFLSCTVDNHNKKKLRITDIFKLKDDKLFYNYKLTNKVDYHDNSGKIKKKDIEPVSNKIGIITKSTILFIEKNKKLNNDGIFKIDKIDKIEKMGNINITLNNEIKAEYLSPTTGGNTRLFDYKPILFYFFVQKPIKFNFKDIYMILPAFINKNDINTNIDELINPNPIEEKKEKIKFKQDFIKNKENSRTRLDNTFSSSIINSQYVNLYEIYNHNVIKVNNNNIIFVLPLIINKNNNFIQYTFINIHKYNFKIVKEELNQKKFFKEIVLNAIIKYDDKPEIDNVYCCKYINDTEIFSTISRTINNGIIYINNIKYNINQKQNIIKINDSTEINNFITFSNNVFMNNTKIKCILKRTDNKVKWYIFNSF
jgi:hypothetical protein